MREEMQGVLRKINEFSSKTFSSVTDERLEDL